MRASLLFTAFEGLIPLVGLGLGAPLGHAIGSGANFIATAVLIGFGLYTPLGQDEHEAQGFTGLFEHGPLAAIVLGLSISIDELAIGFTLGLLGVAVVLVIVVIAVQAFVLAQLGSRLGSRLSERAREGAERLVGIVSAALGVTLLAEKSLS